MGNAVYRIGLFIFICLSTPLIAQEKAFRFHHLSERLTSSQFNYYIYRDTKVGFIWISSTHDLHRFDGKHVKLFKLPNELINIQSPFFESTIGNIWFQADEFLCEYILEEDTVRSTGVNLRPVYLHQDEHILWGLSETEDYLKKYDIQNDSLLLDSIGIGDKYGHVVQMYAKRNGQGYLLFLPRENGFKILDIPPQGKIDTVCSVYDEPSLKGNSVYFENDHTWWVGADTGLVLFRDGNLDTVFSEYKNSKLSVITGIAPIEGSQLLIATLDQGLYVFNQGTSGAAAFTQQIFSDRKSVIEPFEEHIEAIYCDRDQNLWISTQDNGVFFTNLQKRKFITALKSSGDQKKGINHVESLSEDSRGRIWCLTKNGIAVIDSAGNLVPGHERYIGAFGGDEPMHILCDSTDRVWIGMQSGLFLIPRFGAPIQEVRGSKGSIYIFELVKDQFLISTHHGVDYLKIENGRINIRPYELSSSDANAGYTMIHRDWENNIFFCRELKEIIVYKRQGIRLDSVETFEINADIHGFVNDPDRKRVWVASSKGLHFFEKETSSFTLKNDTFILTQNYQGVLLDKEKTLWLSANNGLFKYFPGSTNWQVYGLADGIQSKEYNYGSALAINDHKFMFGGINGINIIDPLAGNELRAQAKPIITSITINGEPLPPGAIPSGPKNIAQVKSIELEYEYNSPLIQFAALEYSDPDSVKFRYSLDGLDRPLERVISENEIEFPSLREGRYRFSLWACNSDGKWPVGDASSVDLIIIVKPPWYRSWKFYLLILSVLALMGYWIYRRRITQIKKEETLKRQLAELRQKEAEAKQRMAETETAILRLQMNPHFIFNSMNSINSYILKKDVGTASDYLGRFAKLMRMILDLAANKYVSVFEEVELLELYMQTEAMRFEERFNYKIIVEDRLDPDEVVLPTMILQPFVENAIWHGISGKEGEGAVTVEFKSENGNLLCSVEDNGVGRLAATDRGKKDHESKALAITARRLELLEKETGHTASYKIIDLEDGTGRPSGTKVLLILPML